MLMKYWMQIAQNMCSLLFMWEENKFLYVMDILDCVAPKSKVTLYMMKILRLESGDSCSLLLKKLIYYTAIMFWNLG